MKRQAGFTLVEMIVVIAIIGTLATMVVVRYAGHTDQAKAAAAKSQLAQLEDAVVSFQSQCGRLPRSLSELVEKPAGLDNWPEGGYLKKKSVPKDPWGNDYVYTLRGRSFGIVSLGADGKEGGTGPDSDLSSDESESGK